MLGLSKQERETYSSAAMRISAWSWTITSVGFAVWKGAWLPLVLALTFGLVFAILIAAVPALIVMSSRFVMNKSNNILVVFAMLLGIVGGSVLNIALPAFLSYLLMIKLDTWM